MKHAYRKRRLFPRTLSEVVTAATNPLVAQKEKFYTALLRDWPTIVGPERAAYLSPQRVQFNRDEQQSATLHLKVNADKAPEVSYMQEQIIEQLARYFGYKAITRLVLHADHGSLADAASPAVATTNTATTPPPLPDNLPREFKSIFERMQKHFDKP